MNLTQVLAAHGLAGKSIALPKDLSEKVEAMWEVSGLKPVSTVMFPEVDDDNFFYMAYGAAWVKKISPNDGAVIWTVPVNFPVKSTCVGQDGFFYVFGETKCLKINRTTGVQTEIVFQIYYPISVGQGTVDSAGNIYVGATFNSKDSVVKFSPSGQYVWVYEIGPSSTSAYLGIIFFDSHIFANQAGYVNKITSNGSLVWRNGTFSLTSVIPDPLDSKCLLSVHDRFESSYSYAMRVDVSGTTGPVIKNKQEIPTGNDSGSGRYPRLRVIKDGVYAVVGRDVFKLRLSDLYPFGHYRDTAYIKGVLSDSTFYSIPNDGLRRVKFSYKLL